MNLPRMSLVSTGVPPWRHRFGYWVTASTYLVLQAFTTVPSPLYPLYAARNHLSALLITLVYAAYAVGVAASLVLAGHLSDTLGRRPVLFAALGLNCVSAVVFLVWSSLAGLFVARIVCGLAVGVTASTATAYLDELFSAHRPDEERHRLRMLSGATAIGGLGLGGLVSGVLATIVPLPLVTPYAVMIGLFLVCSTALVFAPETTRKATPRPRYRPQRLTVPKAARRAFFAALTGVATVFALFGLFVGLAGTLLDQTLHRGSPLSTGAVLCALFGVGAATTALTTRIRLRVLICTAGVFMLVGPALLVSAIYLPTPSLALFYLAAVAIGVGGSALFTVSLNVATALAPRDRIAETLASFFLAGYLGLSAPVIGIGIALNHLTARTTVLGFATAVAVAVAATVPGLVRASRS